MFIERIQLYKYFPEGNISDWSLAGSRFQDK